MRNTIKNREAASHSNADAYYNPEKYDRDAYDVEGTFVNANPSFEKNGGFTNWVDPEGEEHKTGMSRGPENSFHTWEHHREQRVIRKFGRPINVPEDGAHNLE